MSETMTLRGPCSADKRDDRRTAGAGVYEKKLDAHGRAYATGKRKNAVARVWIKPGPGKITVNGRERPSISRGRCCA